MKKIYITILSIFLFYACATRSQKSQENSSQATKSQALLDRSVRPMPGPAPKININKPKEFQLDNGLKVLVVENHKLPRVALNLSLDNPMKAYAGKKGVSDLLSATLGNGTQEISKEDFNEEIESMGAAVTIGANGASARSLKRFFPRILELTAQGALTPRFDKEEFKKEKSKLIQSIKSNEKNVGSVASDLTHALVFGVKHPYGEFATEETIQEVEFEDIVKEYQATFSPENAYLVIVGDVEFSQVKPMVEKAFAAWENFPVEKVKYTDPVDLQTPEINFIHMSNAVQTELMVANIINLKVSDPDYFAGIMANQILGGGGEGRLFLNLREAHGWTYGSYSRLSADKNVSAFIAEASVRNSVTDSAIVELRKELKKIRQEPVTAEELEIAKAKYIGNFVMSVQKPETIASLALNIKTQNLSDDFYENYIKNLQNVTIEDVQRVAQKYFKYDNSRIIVVGNALEILPALEKMNIPIRFFDRHGNETRNPLEKSANLGEMTAEKVIQAYLEKIGGKEKVKNLKSMRTEFLINGLAPQPIQGEIINLAPNKQKTVMKMNGNVMMSTIFDGEKEVVSGMMGNSEKSGEEVADQKSRAGIIPQAFYTKDQITLQDLEKINENLAYKLIVNIGGKQKTEYYDQKSKLLVRTVEKAETPQGPIQIEMDLKNYKKIDGVLMPYQMIQKVGAQEMVLEVQKIVFNKGVTNADFK
ncbi:Peptidase M16 inactive domain [Candidatus Ornithobacterium hominis]|uniref:Peptidase M16 inactive domain n=1 Tax=Candidatus Ornithobacterium hominis TaxID=2497989 RepID=A0A383TYR8_9FLAO|nr:insulinase family protein [Candidatus Ornithobacterium hominis]MCT7904094.1 insulinase family protein [Candidatus Ornithobacterium hominis]SZD72368.1 Peptidase M16 inactive domain [Candidatus Ornithobacterium hominis]